MCAQDTCTLMKWKEVNGGSLASILHQGTRKCKREFHWQWTPLPSYRCLKSCCLEYKVIEDLSKDHLTYLNSLGKILKLLRVLGCLEISHHNNPLKFELTWIFKWCRINGNSSSFGIRMHWFEILTLNQSLKLSGSQFSYLYNLIYLNC